MLLYLLLVSLLAAQSQAKRVFYAPDDAEKLFEEFIATFDKQYLNEEEKNLRFNTFQENLKKINEQNAMGHAVFGITQFTDLTVEEFRQTHTGFNHISRSVRANSMCKDAEVRQTGPVPDSLDWRKKGKVTNIKNQGQCGSCWSFSVTGNLEGQYAIKHNKLIEISEQELLDCDKDDYGCYGGLMDVAMTWISQHGGAMTEKDYPYTEKEGMCKFDKNKVVLKVTGCKFYNGSSEDQIKQTLAEVGPLSIALCADDLQTYKSGVLQCSPQKTQLNHGVLLVGYGQDGNTPYWIIKNSWGEKWGENGYVRVAMYKNSCNMMSYITSAEVE